MFDDMKPVTLTAKAAAEVMKSMKTKNIPTGYGLRVGAQGGSGCGGARLIIGFDKKKDTDMAYMLNGVQIYVDKKHMIYVMGKEVDFYEGSDARGFVFVERA